MQAKNFLLFSKFVPTTASTSQHMTNGVYVSWITRGTRITQTALCFSKAIHELHLLPITELARWNLLALFLECVSPQQHTPPAYIDQSLLQTIYVYQVNSNFEHFLT